MHVVVGGGGCTYLFRWRRNFKANKFITEKHVHIFYCSFAVFECAFTQRPIPEIVEPGTAYFPMGYNLYGFDPRSQKRKPVDFKLSAQTQKFNTAIKAAREFTDTACRPRRQRIVK